MLVNFKSINTLTLSLALTFFLPSISFASECFSPSPHQQKGNDTFKPIGAKNLTSAQRKILKRMFKKMDGRWEGTTTGFFCMGTEKSPRQKTDNYIIEELEVDANSSGDLTLAARMNSIEKGTSRQENMKLFSSSGILRIGQNRKSGDVSVDSLSKGKLAFTQRYRVPTNHGATKKGSFGQEIIRTVSAKRSSLIIEYKVYTQGLLSSKSVWKLRKK